MKKLFVFVNVVFAFGVFLFQPSSVYAAEGGIGHYVPGALADFGDMAPPSGLALMNWYNYYNGSAGAGTQIEEGGLVAANLRATSNAEMVGAAYTSQYGILGGKFAAGLIIPYIWMNVTGSITGPRGNTFSRTDFANGMGDMVLMPFWLNWTCGDFKWAVLLDVYAPTGAYNTRQLANVGLNYWTFEPVVQFSYISKKIRLEISTTAGFDFNTENEATNYQSGDVFHIDATVAEHLPLFGCGIIGLGANAFYWDQFTADSGSGAKLGPFETEMAGVGPVLSYISPPICGHTLVAEVKWLPQIDTSKTLKGDYVWFKLGLAL
ncbi:MAG: transporter [Syntrophobacteraceae bacterium]